MINIDPTNKAGRVIRYHLAHPDLTGKQIAAALDFHNATVRNIVVRYHLTVPSVHLAKALERARQFKRAPYAGRSSGNQW